MGVFASLADDIENSMRVLVERGTQIATEEINYAIEDAYREYGPIEKAKVEEVFRDSVQKFYDSYSPSYYGRTMGLFDVLEIPEDEYGMVATEASGYTDLFNEGNLHGDRNGGSLFEKVFMQGWHGGAAGTDRHGISVGSPHYRVPPGLWSRWGRPAVKTMSPAKLFATQYSSADSGVLQREFNRILDTHVQKAKDKINRLLEDLQAELF